MPYNLKIWKVGKVHQMTPNWTQMTWPEKYSTYGNHENRESQIFIPFALRSTVSRYCTFYDFPIDSQVKFQTATKFLKLGQFQRKVTPLFPHGSQRPHKIGLTLDENCRRSSILKFPALYNVWSCVNSNFKVHKLLKSNTLYPPPLRLLCFP